MKKLTAEEFAAYVMNDEYQKLEYNVSRTAYCRDIGWEIEVWDIYTHITDDGKLVGNFQDADYTIHCEWRVTASDDCPWERPWLSEDEKDTIVAYLYPQYLAYIAELEENYCCS